METRPSPGGDDEVALEELLHLHVATLYRPHVGVRLIEEFGDAEGVLAQPVRALRAIPGVTKALLERLRSHGLRTQAREELRVAQTEGFCIHAWGASNYPPELRHFSDRPLALFATAPLSSPEEPNEVANDRLAVVGTRRPSVYGERQCSRFVTALARHGLEIVSGLARGIDGRAHEAALEAGARTTAVLGCGLGRVYPPEHQALAQRIRSSPGSRLLSEFPFGASPKSVHFPMRNRILMGLAQCLLVLEAGERSGSLITVRHALDQGKTVFVLPGRVDREEARGCLRLLSEGAAMAVEPHDLLVEFPECRLQPAAGPAPRTSEGVLGGDLAAAFAEEDAWHPDALAARCGRPLPEVIQRLNRLELEGHLRRVAGGHYALRW